MEDYFCITQNFMFYNMILSFVDCLVIFYATIDLELHVINHILMLHHLGYYFVILSLCLLCLVFFLFLI